MMLKTFFLLITTGASLFWPIAPALSPAGPMRALTAAKDDSTPITNSSALDPFFRQLAAVEAGARTKAVRIVQYGDSHTKADLFTGAVRKNLLRDFGDHVSRLFKQTTYRPSVAGQPIVIQPLGINGARAKRLSDMSQSTSFLQSLSKNRPDLIVLAYGTNEVTDRDWTVDSYSRMLVSIITRLRSAAPEASFLILGPPDRSVLESAGWKTAARMPLLLEAQRRAAVTAGAAFWSEYDAMGGPGAMNGWVTRGLGRLDHVHFTAAGYSKLAGLFYRDLINAYRGGRSASPVNANKIDLRIMRGVPASSKKPD